MGKCSTTYVSMVSVAAFSRHGKNISGMSAASMLTTAPNSPQVKCSDGGFVRTSSLKRVNSWVRRPLAFGQA